VPGEGKSFVAANLAVSLSRYITDYVLLVDCDLRRPTIHQKFGFEDVPGLNEYLAGKVPLSSLLLKTTVKKLSILPAGKPPGNPSELLSSPKMSNLLNELQTRYEDRWLIIDSPPPHLAPETLAISQKVEAIIIVVKHHSTHQALVEELIASFEPEKILGAVINHFDIRTSRYYGYGRYRTYKKYYHQKNRL
jgi:capsular exopolysaccharide synthesis family protein